MKLSNVWNRLLGQNTGRKRVVPTLAAPATIESMETRQMLSASALFIPATGELNIELNSNDSVRVSSSNGAVLIEVSANGGPYAPLSSIGTVASSSVVSLVVLGGDDANTIDLNGVTAAAFTSLTSISVDAANGQDTIIGSPDFGDSINGGHGEDTISGQGGNDTILGGDGNDLISGGTGNDSINSGDGDDVVNGDDGNDVVTLGNGQDTLNGGNGDDSAFAGNGQDLLNGDAGNDTLNGDGGTDTVNGGDDNDSILGGEFADLLNGDAGNDTMNGQGGNDSIDGGAGDDSLLGLAGNDSLSGNNGNDVLNGGAGNDSVSGGDGNDLGIGGAGTDFLDGNAGNDTLQGQAGNDTLVGGGGIDSLQGGAGNDVVQSLAAGIVVNDLTITEGDTGTFTVSFTVALTSANTDTVTVDFTTAAGSAQPGVDFLSTSGSLAFAPGVTTQSVNVEIVNDTVSEGTELFTLNLSNAVNALLIDNQGLATLNDNDTPAGATLTPRTNVNVSRLAGNQDESSIIVNPSNPQELFAFANNGRGSMFAARSTDGGLTWGPSNGADFVVFDGTDGLPAACCDPTLAWDQFGNLFAVYIDDVTTDTVVALSTDSGQTFARFATLGNGTDQPTVTFGPGSGGVGETVWITFDDGGIQVRSAQVTGLGAVGPFGATTLTAVGQFGDIAVGPNGQLIVAGQSNTAIQLQTDLDGDGPLPLGPVVSIPVNVDTFDAITPQPARAVDAEVGLAFDRSGGTFNGRLYMLYTDETPDESNNTEIFSRFSTDNGATWSLPVRVNDDATTRSQFFSKMAVDQTTGTVAAVWQDARNDSGNTLVETFAAVSIDGGLTWSLNVRISAGQTDGTVAATGGQQLGDYIGLDFVGGQIHATWADNSNSTGDNPDGTRQEIDIYTSRVTVTLTTPASGNGSFTASSFVALTDLGDVLLGGDGDDVIQGASGNDMLNGQNGDDLVFGGDGNDLVFGGQGNDTLDGQAGDDTLDGQGGDDLLIGGDGNDTFVSGGTGAGNDTVEGGDGLNGIVVNGTGSADTIAITAPAGVITVTNAGATIEVGSDVQAVTVNGLFGDDLITIGDLSAAGQTLVVVNGGEGNDTITGQGSAIGGVRLALNGENGDDTIIGSEGADSINGGAGNDSINGRAGNDIITGADGNDILAGGADNDTVLGGAGNDFLTGQTGDDSIAGGDGNDTLRGFEGADTLLGQTGDDLLNGMDGDDSISGGVGKDQITGGSGNDTLDGGRNDDTINGNSGNDLIRGDHGNDYINAGTESDTVNGGDGHDTIIATDGLDLLNGGDGNDRINAGGGNDVISGGDGNDTILGGGGSDIILGGDGEDQIDGQGGTDTVAGNQGIDVITDPASEIDEAFVLSAELLTALEAAG